MENETVAFKCFPGVAQVFENGTRGNFCVHPDGSVAFIFDGDKNTFVAVSLKSGQKTTIKTEIPQMMETKGAWLDFVAIIRSSKLFIIGMKSVGKDNFLISFSFDAETNSICFVDGQLTSIKVKIDSYVVKFQHSRDDSTDQVFFLACKKERFTTTTLIVAQIDIIGNGKVTSTILVSKKYGLTDFSVDVPFVVDSCAVNVIYFASKIKRGMDICASSLLTLPFLNGDSSVSLSVRSSDDIYNLWRNSSSLTKYHYNLPTVIGENVYCFGDSDDGGDCHLHILDRGEEIYWRRIPIDNCEHNFSSISRSGFKRLTAHTTNGLLFLHSKCCLASCEEKAHIFMIDVNEYTGKLAIPQSTEAVPCQPQPPEVLIDYPSEQVILRWLPAGSSLPVLGYDVEFHDFSLDADWHKVNDVLVKCCEITIDDQLEVEGHEFEFRVIAKNEMGSSIPSDPCLPKLIQFRTISREFEIIERLPGIKSSVNSICVHPDGSIAFVFDSSRNSFVKVNLTTGQQNLTVTDPIKEIESARVIETAVVIRSSKLFLLVLCDGLIVSFHFNMDIDKFCIADKQYTGIDFEDITALNFYKNKSEQLYVCSIERDETSTFFSISIIDITEFGAITSTALISHRKINGSYCASFIHFDSFFVILRESTGEAVKKLVEVPLFDISAVIDCKTYVHIDHAIEWPRTEPNWWSGSQVVGDYVFFYAYHIAKETGYLLKLDFKARYCRTFPIDVKGHFIYWPSFVAAENGLMLLHGSCRLKTCSEGAHIFAISPKLLNATAMTLESKKTTEFHVAKPETKSKERETAIQPKVQEMDHKEDKLASIADSVEKPPIPLPRTFPQSMDQNLLLSAKIYDEAKQNDSAETKPNSSTITSSKIGQKPTVPIRTIKPKSAPNANLLHSLEPEVQTERLVDTFGVHPLKAFNENKKQNVPNVPQHVELLTAISQNWAPDTYETGTILGQGHFGIVYKCWDEERRRYFIAKKTKMNDEECIKSALNEIKRLKDLNHRRIIEYYGYKTEVDGIVIFMEYMFRSIADIIKEHGPVPEKTAIIYIAQVLDGLDYLHNMGIVHSDLKCDNLLSDHNGNIKIGDFGLAVQKHLTAANLSYTNPKSDAVGGGTLFWTDPEIFETQVVSRRSDIWSLGCTIVEMLTAKPPYIHLKTPFKLIAACAKNLLSFDPKELVPGATEAMQSFIGCLLQIDSANRPADASEATIKFRIFFT